jgi:beta-lactamase regulating signal transducer with metallopeptidase domain
MDWLYYLLEANFYLCVLYAFYKLALQGSTFYSYNRWYLLCIPLLAFLLPLLKFKATVIPFPILYRTTTVHNSINGISAPITNWAITGSSNIVTWANLFIIIYGIVVLLFLVNSIRGIYKLYRLYSNSSKHQQGDITHIHLIREQEAFSFVNWLFYYPGIPAGSSILEHEMVHIRQKHSRDILFFELLLAFNWFNPIVYLLFKDVKLNHEYIADEKAATAASNKYDYALLLINNASTVHPHPLAQAIFNAYQLKQRIHQLSLKRSDKKVKYRYLLAIPLIVILAVISSFTINKDYGLLQFSIASTAGPSNGHRINIDAPGTTVAVSPFAKKTDTVRKLRAADLLLKWTDNKKEATIRTMVHSVYAGTEAQLFRGRDADTLYVAPSYYELNGGTVRIHTDHLMVSYLIPNSSSSKKLIIVSNKLVVIPQVLIKTTGSIFSVEQPTKESRIISYNMHVREATITGNEIITNESASDNAPYQPDILW